MTIYYKEWMDKECGCGKCSWCGTAGTCVRGGLHRGIYLELYCPECSELVDLIILPEERLCSHGAEGLTPEQLKAREDADKEKRRFLELCLSSPEQLPDLEGEEMILAWDQDKGDTRILLGDTAIWSEPVVYEGFERYERVALVLKEKYGERVKDLVPADRSLLFLYGDYYPSMAYVRKVRKELFGVVVPE
jgi:hypothetical protein